MSSTFSSRDYPVVRELYGVTQTLCRRDCSLGNEVAVLGAQHELRSILSTTVERRIDLPGWLVACLDQVARAPVDQIRLYPLSDVESALRSIIVNCSEDGIRFQPYFVRNPRVPDAVETLVVVVGATIGIGDELLFADALCQRLHLPKSPKLAVCSRQSALWKRLNPHCEVLGEPPVAADDYLDGRSKDERAKTAVVYVDFLESDPKSAPMKHHLGLAFASRWFVGTGRGDFFLFRESARYMLKYPDGMPQSRWLECCWIAGQLIPGGVVEGSPRRNGKVTATPKQVVLQVLTSKRDLMLPPAFYADVFRRLEQALAGAANIQVVPAPTKGAMAVVDETARLIGDAIGHDRVSVAPTKSLVEIFDLIKASDLLVGPDTFTGHMAVFDGMPQVNIMNPEHFPWIAPSAPTFIVEARRDYASMSAGTAKRLWALLTIGGSSFAAQLESAARDWHRAMQSLRKLVLNHAVTGTAPRKDKLVHSVETIIDSYKANRSIVAEYLGEIYVNDFPAFCEITPLSYVDKEERARSLARFYQSAGISDVSAVLELIECNSAP